MGSESISIPDEYVDILVQEFAYDPVRLPLTEDPAQVLYNRRTLETIWDAKHDAVNPFTRQPFDINHVIPQSQLRQQMLQTLRLEVIPDYTKILSKREMKNLLKELIVDYQYLIDGHRINGERYWKVLWRRFNLLRLYCQYRAENRELFSSIRGYAYLSQVVDKQLFNLSYEYYSLCDDAKEVCKEVARFVDIIGFTESDLLMLPKQFFWALVHILSDLAGRCDHLKIQRMVLRIYRRMFYDCSIDCRKIFCSCAVLMSLYVLGRENFRDISNEDLYNGMAVLKSAWIRNKTICVAEFDYVDIIVNVVNICISRFKDMHAAAIADRAKPISTSDTNSRHEDDEVEKNINLISVALDRGLWLINSILTATSHEGEGEFFSDSEQKLQYLDTVGVIVRMVELVLAGFKYVWSSHLLLGINIAATLGRGNEVDQVFGDFLGSEIVDEYDPRVKLSLQNMVHNVNVVETVTRHIS
jgi:hypothetical protein